MNRVVWWSGVVVTFLVCTNLAAFDFMERPRAVLPGPAPSGEGVVIANGGYAHAAYRANQFASTRLDKFQVEGYGNHAIIDAGGFRTSVFYGTYMLNGPVTDDDSPGAAAAQWMMNAIQYEYGVVWSWDLPLTSTLVRTTVLAEYSRRSYHPVRDGFGEPAADVLRAGIAVQGVSFAALPRLRLDTMVRLGWSELYDFWGAPRLPDPRALYTLHGALDARYELTQSVHAFLVLTPDLILLRAGDLSLDGALQLGVRVGRAPSWVELYLDGFTTGDTEQLREKVSPAHLLGYGVRFGIEL